VVHSNLIRMHSRWRTKSEHKRFSTNEFYTFIAGIDRGLGELGGFQRIICPASPSPRCSVGDLLCANLVSSDLAPAISSARRSSGSPRLRLFLHLILPLELTRTHPL